jgi:polyisoprenoid-binding protein YceI
MHGLPLISSILVEGDSVMRIARLPALATLLAAGTFAVAASATLTKTGTSSSEFTAILPMGLGVPVHGTTPYLGIVDDGTTLTVTVPLAQLDTGNGPRNTRVKNALEADRYPNASLRVPRADLRFPAKGAETSGDATGSFTLHGQTKTVTFHYVAKNMSGTISVTGSTTVDILDFGVIPPSYMGVAVKPNVDIATSFEVINR